MLVRTPTVGGSKLQMEEKGGSLGTGQESMPKDLLVAEAMKGTDWH